MNLEQRLANLMAVPEFRGVSTQARAMMAAAMREEFFAEGETLIAAGEHGDRVFVLCEGALEVVQSPMPGVVRRLARGALLGELAFFADDVRTATVRATADCVLLSLGYENFRAVLLKYPEIALILAGRIVRTLRAAETALAQARNAASRKE
jgi:CRP-like cAMP-binding protein